MSRGDNFRISGLEPAHVMAVLKAITRRVGPNAHQAARRFLDLQTSTLPDSALAEIAREASNLLPEEWPRTAVTAERIPVRPYECANGTGDHLEHCHRRGVHLELCEDN